MLYVWQARDVNLASRVAVGGTLPYFYPIYTLHSTARCAAHTTQLFRIGSNCALCGTHADSSSLHDSSAEDRSQIRAHDDPSSVFRGRVL